MKAPALVKVQRAASGDGIVYSRYVGRKVTTAVTSDLPLQPADVERLRRDPDGFCRANGLEPPPSAA